MEGQLVFCYDIPDLIQLGEETYDPNDWRSFTDSSKRSLRDRRDRHWTIKEWSKRENLTPGTKM
jgi:hypothetical protein